MQMRRNMTHPGSGSDFDAVIQDGNLPAYSRCEDRIYGRLFTSDHCNQKSTVSGRWGDVMSQGNDFEEFEEFAQRSSLATEGIEESYVCS